jgi:hypothetical protein
MPPVSGSVVLQLSAEMAVANRSSPAPDATLSPTCTNLGRAPGLPRIEGEWLLYGTHTVQKVFFTSSAVATQKITT